MQGQIWGSKFMAKQTHKNMPKEHKRSKNTDDKEKPAAGRDTPKEQPKQNAKGGER
jgi:hypothetical protein